MRIKSHTWTLYAGLTAASLGALGLPGTLLWLKVAEGTGSVLLYVFVTPFLVAGLFMAYFGIRGLFRLVVHGIWELECPDEGGLLGRKLLVRLIPPRVVTPEGTIRCVMRCARTRQLGGGPKARRETITLWETEWSVQSSTLHPQLGLEIEIPLPDTGEPTNVSPQDATGVRWQLNTVVTLGGVEQQSVFEFPVRAGRIP